MAAASLALACCLAWARPAASSRLHAVTVRPPASYEDRRHGDTAFHRDAVRDRMLFGFLDSGYSEAELTPSYSEAELTPSYSAPRTPRSSAQVPALRRDQRPHYTSISREFDTVLDSAARPGYTQLDRRHMQPDPAGALIDASRFDYEDSYDYEENNQITAEPTTPKKSEKRKLEKRMDVRSGNLKNKLKPKKKIVIRKFRKSSNGEKSIVQKIPKMSKLMKMLKSSKLTPAEFLYLSNKARLEKRKSQLKARSISDSAEEESSRHYSSSTSLHGHQLGQHGPVEYEESQKMQFQIHGQEGPRSYRFGHDTGAGYNRQFRYEERDERGVVRGRYGYYDQGRLRIVNYAADPRTGYTTDIDPVPAAPPPRG